MPRFYYYTGIAQTPAHEQEHGEMMAAKEQVRKLHMLRKALASGQASGFSAEQQQRVDKELIRREVAARQALVRVLKCSRSELDAIHIAVFDQMPGILAIEEHDEVI